MFDSLINLTKNVVNVVSAPVEIVVDTLNLAVKPVADELQEISNSVKELSKD